MSDQQASCQSEAGQAEHVLWFAVDGALLFVAMTPRPCTLLVGGCPCASPRKSDALPETHPLPLPLVPGPTQDAIKKITSQELPDFYNITLERPKDDPAGYDVLYVEAAFKVRGRGKRDRRTDRPGQGWLPLLPKHI
jgi:hypothetical protein